MISHTHHFELALAVFFALLLLVASYRYLHERRTSKNTWELLVSRLMVVDRDNVALIASPLLAGTNQIHLDLEPSQIWDLIGGLEGIEILEANCDVLIDLACYLQRWHPEALVIAEQLRLNAREIKWHLGRLHGAARGGNLGLVFPDYAQRAVMTYFLMTKQVLALYEAAAVPGFFELQGTL